MKSITFFSVMFSITFMVLSTGCEKSADQNQIRYLDTVNQILPREPLDECSDCPLDCCCCGIEFVSGLLGTIQLCGLCEGDYLCGTYSPGSPCSLISGQGKDIVFTSSHRREVFCVEPGASFRIYNPGSSSIVIQFTCEYDVTPPPFQTITLQAHEERFFYNDGSCVSEGC